MKGFLRLLIGAFILISSSNMWAEATPKDSWMVWAGSEGEELDIYYSHQKAGQWSTPERLHQSNQAPDSSPSIAVDQEGKVWAVWVREKNEAKEIILSKWNGMEWSPEETVGHLQGVRFSQVSITLDEAGLPWILASGVEEKGVDIGAYDEIYWIRKTSTGWSGWEKLNLPDASPDIDPAILAFDGKVCAVWSGFNGQGYQLFQKIWDGKEWGEEIALFQDPNSSVEFPSLRVENGNPALLFYQGGKVFLSQWSEQSWTSPVETSVTLESTFLDVWKNQSVSRTEWAWFTNNQEKGAIHLLLRDSAASSSGSLLLSLKKFFDVSINEAWAAGQPNVYLAFGDSITQGGYPPHLQGLLDGRFPGSSVVNRGRGGERTNSGLNRINGALNSANAEFLLLMEGTNDCGDERSPESITFNLERMVDRSISFGTRPIISTITPRLDGHSGKVKHTNAAIRAMAGRKGISLVENYNAIRDRADFRSLYVDHVHFNATGNSIIAQTWFSTISSIKGGGDGGGGGCGTIGPVSGNSHPINFEPLLCLIFFLFLARKLEKVSRNR